MDQDLKKEHDELIANKPDTMSDGEFYAILEEHKPNCKFGCNDETETNTEDNPEGGDMEKSFSQEEVDTLVEAAVAPLKAELETFKESAAKDVEAGRVAEVEAAANEQIATLQADLEAAVLKATNAETEFANYVAQIEAAAAEAELDEWAAALREDRKSKIADATNFPADFIEANLDRWCAESDEDFAARVEEWKISSVKVVESEEAGSTDSASLDTAMSNVRPVNTDGKTAGILATYLAS